MTQYKKKILKGLLSIFKPQFPQSIPAKMFLKENVSVYTVIPDLLSFEFKDDAWHEIPVLLTDNEFNWFKRGQSCTYRRALNFLKENQDLPTDVLLRFFENAVTGGIELVEADD